MPEESPYKPFLDSLPKSTWVEFTDEALSDAFRLPRVHPNDPERPRELSEILNSLGLRRWERRERPLDALYRILWVGDQGTAERD